MKVKYAGKEVDNLEQIINDQISNFVELIDTKYVSSSSVFRPVDFARKVQYYTLDVISNIAFGSPFGYLTADDDLYGYIKTTEDTIPVMIVVALIPWLMRVVQSPLMKMFLPTEKDVVGLGRIMGYVHRLFTS